VTGLVLYRCYYRITSVDGCPHRYVWKPGKMSEGLPSGMKTAKPRRVFRKLPSLTGVWKPIIRSLRSCSTRSVFVYIHNSFGLSLLVVSPGPFLNFPPPLGWRPFRGREVVRIEVVRFPHPRIQCGWWWWWWVGVGGGTQNT